MRPLRGSVWGCALVALLGGSGSARAAWNNVFQVCCHHCRSATAYASPLVAVPQPCPQPCPQQVCTTRYVQRCYYQPVTSYQTTTYYEPVTTYRTSYYYEPVCSYRYSCYYDPCTCRYQQIAQPVTSYRLRSQCCPVTSYLQRCALKPVTTYQQMTYYEPVTTCCTTTVGPPVAAPPAGGAVVPAPPAGGAVVPAPSGGAVPPPGVIDSSTPPPPTSPPPAVTDPQQQLPANRDSWRYPSPTPPARMPNASDSGYFRQPQLRAPQPMPPAPPTPPLPRARLDRIASLPNHNMEGEVLDTGRAPQVGARVLFVSADRKAPRQTVTTDGSGQFRLTLASGAWFVYVEDASGTPVYKRKVEVRGTEPARLTLVSR
jgi:hypothetical protein